MKIFINTFLKVLASLISIAVFVFIIATFISFSENTKNKNQFKFIEGDENSINKIAILKLDGPIINHLQNFNNLQDISIISGALLKNKLKQIKAIKPKILIISINSPGGTVSASYEAFNIIEEFKKENNLTIYFHTSETLASGAYWLSLSGDKIFASYGSLIGSIGVKGPDWIYYDEPIAISSGIFSNSIETKKGIKVYSQNAGKSKDILNPFRKPTKNELDHLKNIVTKIYEDFLTRTEIIHRYLASPMSLAFVDNCVIDADAITCFENNPTELFIDTYPHTILTPHEGEFKRLFGSSRDRSTKYF